MTHAESEPTGIQYERPPWEAPVEESTIETPSLPAIPVAEVVAPVAVQAAGSAPNRLSRSRIWQLGVGMGSVAVGTAMLAIGLPPEIGAGSAIAGVGLFTYANTKARQETGYFN